VAKSDSERSCAEVEDNLALVIQRSLSEGAAQDDLWKSSRGDFLKHQAARAKKTNYSNHADALCAGAIALPAQGLRPS